MSCIYAGNLSIDAKTYCVDVDGLDSAVKSVASIFVLISPDERALVDEICETFGDSRKKRKRAGAVYFLGAGLSLQSYAFWWQSSPYAQRYPLREPIA